MRKLLGFALAALMAFGGAGALAEADAATLGGVVIEVAESSILIQTAEFGEVLVNYDETTDLLEAADEIAPGAYIIVHYNGAMTRSLPPQIFAQRIASYVIRGTVVEVRDAGVLIEDEIGGQVFALLKPELGPLFYGSPVDVYFSGVMTASFPGQVFALHVATPRLEGTITQLGDGFFLMEDAEGVAYMVNNDDGTSVDAPLTAGDSVTIYYNGIATYSLPAQIYALGVVHPAK
jgi:hypothetical protein